MYWSKRGRNSGLPRPLIPSGRAKRLINFEYAVLRVFGWPRLLRKHSLQLSKFQARYDT